MPWMQVVVLAAYLLSPLDLIPDPVPFLGNLDDLVAMWMLVHRVQQQFGRRSGCKAVGRTLVVAAENSGE